MAIVNISNQSDRTEKYGTQYFNVGEIINASTFEGTFPFNTDVLKVADFLRERLGKPIHVESAYRSPEYNASIGGVNNSQHVSGNALDLHGDGLMEMVKEWRDNHTNDYDQAVFALGMGGLGLYDWGIHIDVRDNGGALAFWDYRKKKGDGEIVDGSAADLSNFMPKDLTGWLIYIGVVFMAILTFKSIFKKRRY